MPEPTESSRQRQTSRGKVSRIDRSYFHRPNRLQIARRWLILAGLGLGLLADNILVANNARDYETDLAVGKRTTVVRLGRGFARNLHGFNTLVGLACLGAVFGWAPLALLPLGLWQHLAFRQAVQPADFVPFLGRAAGLMLLATVLCVTATCLGWVPAGTLWTR